MEFSIILLETSLFGLPCLFWWILFSLGAFLLGWLLDRWLFGQSKVALAKKWEDKYNQEHQRNITWEKDYSTLKYEFEELENKLRSVRNELQICDADKMILQGKLDRCLEGSTNSTTTGEVSANQELEAEISALKGQLESTQQALEQCEAERNNLGQTQANEEPIIVGSKGLDLSYGNIFASDNLQIIEGIGPKIESLLKEGGINTWEILSQTSLDKLKEILNEAGTRFRMHDPSSWTQQAAFAASGNWQGLIGFQHRLSGGMLTDNGDQNPSKLEKLAMKILGFSNDPEDLKIVEGIGPKIEQLLKADGIVNWEALGAATKEQLQAILNKAGDRYRLADPTTWPKQSQLAAQGLWKELSEYQDYLQGGKEPTT